MYAKNMSISTIFFELKSIILPMCQSDQPGGRYKHKLQAPYLCQKKMLIFLFITYLKMARLLKNLMWQNTKRVGSNFSKPQNRWGTLSRRPSLSPLHTVMLVGLAHRKIPFFSTRKKWSKYSYSLHALRRVIKEKQKENFMKQVSYITSCIFSSISITIRLKLFCNLK